PLSQDVALRKQDHAFEGPSRERSWLLCVLKAGQGAAGGSLDCQRPDDALGICNPKTLRRLRVLLPQQRHSPLLVQIPYRQFYSGDIGRGYLGNVRESVCQRVEVKPCTTNKNELLRGICFQNDSFDSPEPLPGRKTP